MNTAAAGHTNMEAATFDSLDDNENDDVDDGERPYIQRKITLASNHVAARSRTTLIPSTLNFVKNVGDWKLSSGKSANTR